ncbi:MAG TPA: DUF3105 domain-containing protein [Gaiellaceae bacterium]
MARKVKTPPPPRRAVQAPKQRTTPRDDTRNRKILYAIGASGFVMLAVVVGFFALAGGDDDAEGAQGAIATIRQAGWTYRKPPDQGRDHVPVFTENFKYNTVPGTSGEHSNQTVIYGVYDQPVSEINYVHNLEHGAVGMFYGPDVPEAEVARMQEYYSADPNGLIMAPDSRLGDEIALTAWNHVAKGKAFDESVFDTFVEEFGFRGPESCKNDIEQGCFRRSNLEPGNQ